ncbi:hypothetical protein [Streptomyces sp. NPDC005533]|uniref:hypothetical protein n=1 Tax=Streptomyces sp. NPDC005533 TaxID=3364723 RepID=UPI003676D18C
MEFNNGDHDADGRLDCDEFAALMSGFGHDKASASLAGRRTRLTAQGLPCAAH